jgi:hypothetical protein
MLLTALFEKAAAASWLKYTAPDLMTTAAKAIMVSRKRRRFGEIPSISISSVLFHVEGSQELKEAHGIFQLTGSEPLFMPSSIKG